MKQSYTSGEAARLCGLGISTVKRWVSRGALKAYRTPGGDLRILREHLVDFMREFKIPLHRSLEEDGPCGVLICTDDPQHTELLLRTAAAWNGALACTAVHDDMDMGYHLATLRPGIVILTARDPKIDRERLAHIRRILTPRSVRIGMICADGLPPMQDLGADRPEVVITPAGNSAWDETLLQQLAGTNRPADTVTRRAG